MLIMAHNGFQNDLVYREPIPEEGIYPQPSGNTGLRRVDVRQIAAAMITTLIQTEHELHRPADPEGLKETKRMAVEGIEVNVTLCFPSTQALLAANAGAWYVARFIGRLEDISWSGMELIRLIVTIYKNYGYKTFVLVASVRHPPQGGRCGSGRWPCPFRISSKWSNTR